ALASWLFKVARRIAVAARARASRRAARERQLAPAPPTDLSADLFWHDVRPVLDAEIDLLPDKYRAPFVLCYLQGQTTAEAAQHLGCPPGPVGTRLAGARERLRLRLARRGVTLSSAGLATLLATRAAEAAIPPALIAATSHLACPPAAATVSA